MHTMSVGEECVYLPAANLLQGIVVILKNHPYSIYVVDLLKRDLLGLHLVEYGVCALHTSLDLILESGIIKHLPYGPDEFLHNLFTMIGCLAQLLHNLGILRGVLIFEGEILQLKFYLE